MELLTKALLLFCLGSFSYEAIKAMLGKVKYDTSRVQDKILIVVVMVTVALNCFQMLKAIN